jgi:hypothetical protein
VLETVCRIPDVYFGWTRSSAQRSLRHLVGASDYAALGPQLSRRVLSQFVRAHPEFVEQWVCYSEDKHT